tara:strand:- start:709 stop:1197 length:489 start_codon:yes stop_codon:yes gene_type:complete
MGKILITSATSGNNLILANQVGDLIDKQKDIISLEDFSLPLYTPAIEKVKNRSTIDLCNKFINSDGLIFFAPEYNGGSPPILTNAITWLSLATDNWREAFVNKKVLIGTHSGGAGYRFLSTFRVQLEHLGAIVYPRTIMINRNKEFKAESVKNIIKGYIELL